MSCCCGKNKGKFYNRPFDDECGCNKCNKRGNNLNGISCPFHNNNDCTCAESLREAAFRLTNQRVIIHVNGCKMCVVIVDIGCTFIKTINPCTQRIVYFNVNRIDNIEDVLPRCY